MAVSLERVDRRVFLRGFPASDRVVGLGRAGWRLHAGVKQTLQQPAHRYGIGVSLSQF